VGQVFDEIYGEHYSKSSISRMIEYVRKEVDSWLHRDLDSYYPIVFVDCVHIKVFRKRKAAAEAFYVILGVTEDGTREVLGIYNNPVERATGRYV
jgi:transposase-like protein